MIFLIYLIILILMQIFKTTLYLSSWILLTAKSPTASGASRHPSSLTVSQTRLPCPPCRKMELQSWTVVVAINKLWSLNFERSWWLDGYVVELPPLKPWCDTAEMPKLFCPTATEMSCTNDGGLLPQKCPVQMMGEIMRLCIGQVCWTL